MGLIGQLVYTPIMGIPLVAIGGMITLLALILTAIIGIALSKGKGNFTLKQHKILAILAVILGIIHGSAVMLAYMGF